MKKFFPLTTRLWQWPETCDNWVNDYFLTPREWAKLGALGATIGYILADIAILPVTVTRFVESRRAVKRLLSGEHRKTRLEPYHVPDNLPAKFEDALLDLLCREFLEDQLRRDLEKYESCIQVDKKVKKTQAYVHLKFTRKVSRGKRQSFEVVHYFLALSMSVEDRVVHIDRVYALRNSHHSDTDGREAEFKAFIAGTFHNPFDFQQDPVASLLKRKPKSEKYDKEEVPVSETPGAINPVSE